MSFESPTSSKETKEKEPKKGVILKSLIAVTDGVLNRNAKPNKGNDFIISAADKARETYKSLENLEKEIDPTGNLSGEIEERIVSGFNKLTGWLNKKQTPEQKEDSKES